MDVLEKHLNNETINQSELNKMFRDEPDLLPDIEVDGAGTTNIDKHLWNAKPKFMSFKEAKPGQLFHCTVCEKSFRRADNYRRHCQAARHLRRVEAATLAAAAVRNKSEKKDESN